MTEGGAIECTEHGTRETTYVCRHLPGAEGLGFNYGFADEDPDALFPDAWCDACEAVREREGGWNERTEAAAGIQLLCSDCYQKARLLNWPRRTHRDLADHLEEALPYLEEQQERLRSAFRIDDYDRYDWNQESGQLVFSRQGVPIVVADIQFVGSISLRSHTWMWSWANESLLEPVKERAREVRAYGEEHCLLKLACACWSGQEEDGWQMAAIAAYLLKAQGAYRSPDEGRFSFLLMTNVHWAQ
jgi:hypothetical protein